MYINGREELLCKVCITVRPANTIQFSPNTMYIHIRDTYTRGILIWWQVYRWYRWTNPSRWITYPRESETTWRLSAMSPERHPRPWSGDVTARTWRTLVSRRYPLSNDNSLVVILQHAISICEIVIQIKCKYIFFIFNNHFLCEKVFPSSFISLSHDLQRIWEIKKIKMFAYF